MRIGVLALALLFFSVSASAAITLELLFGAGITHNASHISAAIGPPAIGTQYYFTSSGVSTSYGDAFVVSDVNQAGSMVFQEVEKSGDCTWRAYVGGTAVDLNALDGRSVAANSEVKWSVSPNAGSVTHCKLVFDMNVS